LRQLPDIRNEVFLIADATPVSLPEIIAGLRNGMGRPANLIPIPPVLLANIFRMWQMSEDWKKLAGNLDVSVAKLNSIGYSPVIATPEGLAAMAAGNGGSGQYFTEAMKARPSAETAANDGAAQVRQRSAIAILIIASQAC
jgi:nucleoside-diphosphate-sugar epimerase